MRVSILPPVCSTTGDAGGSYCGDDIDGRCLEAAGGCRRSAGGCHIRCVNLTSNTQQLLSITDGSPTDGSSSDSSRAAQQMMPNNLSLAIATLGIFLTKYACNGSNPDVNSNVAKVAALAAEEARKRLPISLTAKGMPSSSLPILIATLVTFLSKYTHSAAANVGEEDIAKPGNGNSNVILHLTERAHADKKMPPKQQL